MTAVDDASPVDIRHLVAGLAHALGQPETTVLGRPVALALRWEQSGPRVFLSGLPHDVIARACDAFGAAVDRSGDGEAATLAILDEWWSTSEGPGIGTGPVVVPLAGDDARDDGGTQAPMQLCITNGTASELSKLDEAQALRAQLRRAAVGLDAGLAQPPELGPLRAALDSDPEAAGVIVGNVAQSRLLVGRYLLDAADVFDDERIDQLGDGYVRAAHLWGALPTRREPDLLRDVLALERSCADWMYGASTPPTRYTF
jgi:hypothetical protein